VTFNANGGTGAMASETESSAMSLTTNTLTLVGSSFVGWNTSSNGSGTSYADGATYAFGSSVTLYAQWNSVPYAVTFNANGGIGTMANEVATGPTALSNNNYARSGYTFTNWNTNANGSGTSYAGGASYPFSTSTTLYAQWSVDTFTVTFNLNGGSGSMSPETASSATALTANASTRVGYSFTNWNTNANGSGTSYADGAIYAFTSSVTLYAQWSAISYTVTFNANGGTGTMANETSASPENLTANGYTRTGYTFSNWNTNANGSGTSYLDGSSYPFTSSATLYAQWSAISYTVTFNANGGTGTMANETDNAATPLTTNTFTKSGYSFSGWNTSSNDSGTSYADGASYAFTSSTTLYAQWSIAAVPVITAQPVNQTVAVLSLATFSAAATGSGTTTVQWYQSSNDGSTWSLISGAVSTSYSVTTSASNNDYLFRAVFTDAAGYTTSSSASLVNLDQTGNWSGYAATGSVFTAVSAQWTVPTLTCPPSNTSYAVQWVGIDGYGSSSVEQDGTDTDCIDGIAQYGAWYEMFGDASVNNGYQVSLSSGTYPVLPGDVISASVNVSGGVWTLHLADATEGWTFSTNVTTSAPQQTSAEVIVETPGICTPTCTVAALADFGSETFSNVSVSASGVAGPITQLNYFALEIYTTQVLALSGSLNPAGTAFTDTWENS
jgi:uncharacterized repeat protein (TIGR02543 family)